MCSNAEDPSKDALAPVQWLAWGLDHVFFGEMPIQLSASGDGSDRLP